MEGTKRRGEERTHSVNFWQRIGVGQGRGTVKSERTAVSSVGGTPTESWTDSGVPTGHSWSLDRPYPCSTPSVYSLPARLSSIRDSEGNEVRAHAATAEMCGDNNCPRAVGSDQRRWHRDTEALR